MTKVHWNEYNTLRKGRNKKFAQNDFPCNQQASLMKAIKYE